MSEIFTKTTYKWSEAMNQTCHLRRKLILAEYAINHNAHSATQSSMFPASQASQT